MKQILTSILVLMSSILMAQNDQAAKNLLDKVSDKMSNYQDIYIEFDYNLLNKNENVSQNASGDALLKGDKYVVNFFETTQIFDGSKTYTIIPENEEVNISAYAVEEEGALTPSKFYSFYKNGYTYALGKKNKVKGKSLQWVELTPIDSNSEITKVLIGIDETNQQIYTITQVGSNGTETTLTVKKMVTNQQVPDQKFIFNQKKYDDLGYIIND